MTKAEVQAAMCEGKQRFTCHGEARRVAKRMRSNVDVFPCDFCGGWHVGRSHSGRAG